MYSPSSILRVLTDCHSPHVKSLGSFKLPVADKLLIQTITVKFSCSLGKKWFISNPDFMSSSPKVGYEVPFPIKACMAG